MDETLSKFASILNYSTYSLVKVGNNQKVYNVSKHCNQITIPEVDILKSAPSEGSIFKISSSGLVI